jgi:hypothetical protein
MCGATFTESNGIISSPNYPVYDQSLNCNATIKTQANMVIKAYVLGMAINEE